MGCIFSIRRDFELVSKRSDTTKVKQFLSCKDSFKTTVIVDTFVQHKAIEEFDFGKDAQRVICEPNAGGNSTTSEALSMEYLARKFDASDVVTEMEIEYCNPHWKKMDLICTINQRRVGVSVTRAMGFPTENDFTFKDACRLLHKKLYGLIVAKDGVSYQQKYDHSVLHVWCQSKKIAKIVQEAFQATSPDLGVDRDVLLILTVAENCDFIFFDQCRFPAHIKCQPSSAVIPRCGSDYTAEIDMEDFHLGQLFAG